MLAGGIDFKEPEFADIALVAALRHETRALVFQPIWTPLLGKLLTYIQPTQGKGWHTISCINTTHISQRTR